MATPMHPVSSSNISYLGYDEDDKTLYVTFSKGGTYKYLNVSEETFNEFKNSSSVGKYYLSNIKGKYESSKI
jgi:hypothetical protein